VIQLGGKYVLYSIFIEFIIPMKLLGLIKKFINGTCSKERGASPIHNDLKQGDALSQLLFNFSVEYTIRKAEKTKRN
jgi:hypothetical protein